MIIIITETNFRLKCISFSFLLRLIELVLGCELWTPRMSWVVLYSKINKVQVDKDFAIRQVYSLQLRLLAITDG